uniref:Uncharacterized protein n=1 Tax=Prolemur simus TaxID=1328070 RepID=A0A8C9AZX0_PROSS
MKGSSRPKLDQRIFMEHEYKDNRYLLSSKISSRAFSKVYLAYAIHKCMQHNPKLSWDLQGKRHTMVRQLPPSPLVASSASSPAPQGTPCPKPTQVPSSCSGYLHHNVPQPPLQTHTLLTPSRDPSPYSLLPPCTSCADFGFLNCTGLKNSLLSTFCSSVAYMAQRSS